MPRTKISEFSSTAANNTDIDSINIAENCPPSSINDAIRELMAQLKDFQTGAVGDSFNGPIGTSTAAAGAFTTLSATGAITSTLATGTAPLVIASTTKVANLNVDLLDGADWAAPAALGSTTPAAGSFTTLSASSTVTLSGGTANGVAYLNGSKVVTSGSALTFDGTNFSVTGDISGTWTSGATRFVGSQYLTGSTYQLGMKTTMDTRETQIFAKAADTGGYVTIATGITPSERLRVDGSGNVGIGTSSPLSKLQVAANTSIAWGVGGSATYGATTIGSASTSTSSLFVNTASLNTGYSSGLAVDGTYSSSISTVNLKALGVYSGGGYGGQLAFWTSSGTTATQQMLLDSSGNLGLGVTPSAWASSYTSLQMKGGSVFIYNVSSDRMGIGQNSYVGGSGSTYVNNGYASQYLQLNSEHRFYTAPSGTAGNAITFTQAMTLTSGGDLLLGATSTSVYEKFVLNGRAYLTNQSAPGTPTGGGVLYVEGGALKYKGSSGTVTTLAAA